MAGCVGRAVPSGAPANGTRTCTIARSSGICVLLDSHKARPKAEPSHVPLHEGARKGERTLFTGHGHSVRGWAQPQERQLPTGLGAAYPWAGCEAGRNRLRQVHVDRA